MEREDVNEAMRLMDMSKQSLYDEEQAARSGFKPQRDRLYIIESVDSISRDE